MVKQLHLKLNQVYKSFKLDFEQDFIGDLIILSGVNGSGKTQLIDIIKGYKSSNPNDKINRLITQDGVHIDDTVIAHKSFRDYSSIGELTDAQVNNLFAARNTIFDWYTQFRLDFNHPNANSYRDVIKRAKIILVTEYGEERFDSGSLTREEIKIALPKDFVLFQDDIFANKIGEIFFNYVSLVYNRHAEAGRTGTRFETTTLPIAPWTELNNLFIKLGFGYRFKDSYQRINDEIDEQPAIYAIKDDGSIDLTQKRMLTDLSDGEKALISLTFAVLASGQTHPKVLLLDEYDATLNPSLTTAFFIILEEFFIKKDVQVIVVTHSSSTLSLAPEYASFYEVYRSKDDRPRLLQVQRDQYEELAIANKKFYEKIENQETRYLEIEEENGSLKELVEKLRQTAPTQILQIFTEGNNIGHIEKAITILDASLLEKIAIVRGVEDKTSKHQLKQTFETISRSIAMPKTLFVWDCDAVDIVTPLIETACVFKYCLPQNTANAKIKNGIENLYPQELLSEDMYTSENEKIHDNGRITTTRDLDKRKFLAKIQTLTDVTAFGNFQPLIEKIRMLLPSLITQVTHN